MSSSVVAVCLLVLLGVVFAFGSPVHYVTDEVKNAHESIADLLKLKKPEVSTNPLFDSVISSINTSCQRKEEVQLMNVTLDIYSRIFSSILNNPASTLLDQISDEQGDREQVESELKKYQEKIKELKSNLSRPHPHHNRENVLSKLNKIQVDDTNVQKKALAQFLEIYQAASVIGSRKC